MLQIPLSCSPLIGRPLAQLAHRPIQLDYFTACLATLGTASLVFPPVHSTHVDGLVSAAAESGPIPL